MSQFKLGNKYLVNSEDFFYHFGFGITTVDIPALFGDTKFVCCGGSCNRFAAYAERFAQETGHTNSGNLSRSDRYVLYKTGPVLWVNHGIGGPSLSIMLIEILKLIHHAKAKDVTFIRLGTSGGVGVDPGTVVVTSEAMNGGLESNYIQYIAGEKVVRPTVLDEQLSQQLLAIAQDEGIPSVLGKTLCANDFYEGQMRLDGFFCEYQAEEKFKFLEKLNDLGVKNIEMESTCFASYTHRAGIKAGIVCVALLNRMNGDSIEMTKEQSIEFEERPYRLVTALIRRQLNF